jgi:hypothetical protein
LELPERTEIGFNVEADRAAGHFVTEGGIVVVHSGSPGVVARRNARPANEPAA